MNTIFAVPRQTPATNEPSQVLCRRRLCRRRIRTERTPSAEGRRQKALGAHEARWTLRQKLRPPCLGSRMRARGVGFTAALALALPATPGLADRFAHRALSPKLRIRDKHRSGGPEGRLCPE